MVLELEILDLIIYILQVAIFKNSYVIKNRDQGAVRELCPLAPNNVNTMV